MKTAVEFLVQELSNNGYFPYGVPSQIVEQAKQMEKDEITRAFDFGWNIGKDSSKRKFPIEDDFSEIYYNNRYKQDETNR